ncbi:cell cycle checkpoint control protein RAD9A isoform X5 [Phyllopteryx taeniolatus]|uniref:cell cycle checkpoint control protein RAD9A isoform X5 n=1 Tax=Phyllopteryx taeniolatus TaxID=161469 RepID=UPI002AD46937|nr:cell cycle checkpoint control protein RAD9A isoform X5 [Phyllopteryx taeniolatus]
MDCVVTGGNVKVLAKAIHSLSRIGDELYVEPQGDGVHCPQWAWLPLQDVNKECAGSVQVSGISGEDGRKVSYPAGQAKGSPHLHAALQTRLLVDTVAHFPVSLEEVTLSVSDERMWLRNHVDEELAQSKAMLTELCLASDEFDNFAVQAHISITFCLKELRGLLFFADSTGLPISMYFNEPGSPLVLSVSDSVLEGNFVLATLSDDTRNNTRGPTSPEPPPDDFMNDDMDSYLIAMDNSIAPGPSTAESTSSKRHTVANRRARLHSEGEEGEETAEKDGPPNKKFCSLLFGSVLPLSSQMSIQPMSNQEVLASDSEDDTQMD